MKLINIFTILFIISITIFLIIKNKDGFLHPGHPSWPWYWYNFPTRMYVPTRNMVTDIRGDPRCPHFGKCGTKLRKGHLYLHHERHPSNYLWWNPIAYPHFYYYDYYYPAPVFDYSTRYDANGNLYKIKEEKVKSAPSASNNTTK